MDSLSGLMVRLNEDQLTPIERIILLKKISNEYQNNDINLDPNININPKINAGQQLAVQKSMDFKNILVLNGPPGTGKTTTLAEIVKILLNQKKKILFASPSNVAVDNLLAKLTDYSKEILRLGHLGRIGTQCQKFHISHHIKNLDEYKDINDAKRSLQRLYVIHRNSLNSTNYLQVAFFPPL
ncbi:MAG: hypothetical protein MHPSP_003063 [Paramarteilia canceri]